MSIDDTRIKRLKFRAWHRGFREADLILGPFADKYAHLLTPEQFDAFMWHREVFALPDDAVALGGSETSPVQGFSWDGSRVIGLLCHLEATPESVAALLEQGPPPEGHLGNPHPQTERDMLADPQRFVQLAPLLDRLLSQWLRPLAA